MARLSINQLALVVAALVLAGAFLTSLQSDGFASPAGALVAGCTPTNKGIEVCDGIDNNCDGRIDENVKNCISTAPPIKQELLVKKAGDGRGTVVSTPSGINCGTVCSARYNQGDIVHLVATPLEDTTFGGWSGACSTRLPDCTVAIDSQKTATATFNLQGTTLIIRKSGTGSGTITTLPAGIDCGSTCTHTYPHGIYSVALTATPASGSVFVRWDPSPFQCITPTYCILSFFSTAPVTLTAKFDRSTPNTRTTTTLTVTKAGAGLGLVKSVSGLNTLREDGQINCGLRCTATYSDLRADASVGLIATPATGSIFGGWQGDCGFAGEDHSICIPNNMNGGSKTFIATFLPAPQH